MVPGTLDSLIGCTSKKRSSNLRSCELKVDGSAICCVESVGNELKYAAFSARRGADFNHLDARVS
jgi:hypothetical protein